MKVIGTKSARHSFARRIATILIGTVTAVGLLAASGSAVTVHKQAIRPSGVTMVAEDNGFSTGSATWVPIPTSITKIEVSRGTVAFLKGSFSAESACLSAERAAGFCSVRIVLDRGFGPEPFEPVTEDFAFDSPEQLSPAQPKLESHAVERSSEKVEEGGYRVWVEVRVQAPAIKFAVDDWHFTVEAMCFDGPVCTP